MVKRDCEVRVRVKLVTIIVQIEEIIDKMGKERLGKDEQEIRQFPRVMLEISLLILQPFRDWLIKTRAFTGW